MNADRSPLAMRGGRISTGVSGEGAGSSSTVSRNPAAVSSRVIVLRGRC